MSAADIHNHARMRRIVLLNRRRPYNPTRRCRVTVSARLHRSLLAGLLALAGFAEIRLLVPSFRLLGQAPAASRTPRAAIEPAERFVIVNGLRIHYLDWGNPEKPPLILLHGIARVAHTFDHIAPALRDRYHVIA